MSNVYPLIHFTREDNTIEAIFLESGCGREQKKCQLIQTLLV
jgi:hypothetical protein